MPEGTLTAIGDEAIEARIVAWVLGEASAFEAAELERLCAERPELAIFHRRMLALHGLIGEAGTPKNDAAWKLPVAKRAEVLNRIEREIQLPDPRRETRVRRSATRSILSIAACLIFVVIILGLSAPMFMNQRKKSDVIAAYSAAKQRELAAMEEEMIKEERMVALSPDFPKELIEGTPKPMVLPERTPNSEPSVRFRQIEPLPGQNSAPADAMVMADVAEDKKVSTNMARKPSSPSSSMSDVIASASVGATSIPVPEVDVTTPSLDLGAGDDFGTGWGGSVDQLRSGKAITQGNRSGEGAIAHHSIDAVLNNPQAGGLKSNLSQAERSNQSEKGAGNSGAGNLALAAGEQPARTNPAFTQEHVQKVEEVRQNLYMADGNYNLGKYDDAKRDYENVLRTDPYNSAARRGLEQLAAARSDYYRAAYDHTRAELLAEVDNGWELDVPEQSKVGRKDHIVGFTGDDSAVDAKDDALRDQSQTGGNKAKSGKLAEFDGFMNYGSPIGGKEDARAQLLADVDKAWEMNVPAEKSKIEIVREFQYPAGYEPPESPEALAKAIREQEEKVEERRKMLATIVRTKGIIYSGLDPHHGKDGLDGIQKSLDTQDYLNAKREFENEQALLDALKKKLSSTPQPKPDPASFIEELSAAEDPYSTFSLNISDASFQIAKAALAKGERPDPAGIKVEQFYNAVDYGDPAPRAGEPVACAIEQAAHPVIPGRNLMRVSLKTAAAGRSASQPLRLTLLVDQSGSMSRADRREAMHKALASLGTLLTEKDLVNVVGFSRIPRLLADGIKGDAVGKQLADMINQAASEGGTNLETAIDLASQLAQRRMLAGAQNRIVLFTDGAANLGNADPARLAEKVKTLRQQGIAFDIAGIAADDLNDNLLAELARNGNGRYSVVGKGDNVDFAKQLAGAFRPAAENVKVQVRFNPERVARYKLIGFEKDRLKTEDFRNDAVDAAELAAEEAGVAIYQVEPIANGRGEIGEVSVRFRDTARGEMVERMWTMTHNPSAPALDQAAPSMQLATLAMLAAEKLKGGPLADAIDFKQLATSQATVKQIFGNDTRTADMLRVIDALK